MDSEGGPSKATIQITYICLYISHQICLRNQSFQHFEKNKKEGNDLPSM